MITRQKVVVIGALIALAVAVLLTPRTEDPDSTLALRRFLANLGLEVSERPGLPSADGTLVLIADIRTEDEVHPILDWVRAGGHLVVTDPTSGIVDAVGASTGSTLGFVGAIELAPGCAAPGVVGVGSIVARVTDSTLHPHDPAFIACFPEGDGAWMLARSYGKGSVTLFGGVSAFTNEFLAGADNAALAAGISSAGSEVVFGPPATTLPGSAGIWDVMPENARVALIAVALAALAFALVRARRLGGPIVEEPVTPIAGSELVRAAGRLYRAGRATAYAGTLLRNAAVSRLGRRFVAADAKDLAAAIARERGLPRDRVEHILAGPDPRDDDELLRLGAELEELSAEAEVGST